MFNPSDAIYLSGQSETWQTGSNSRYIVGSDASFTDIMNNTTQRSYMSHMPLQPPHANRTYGDSSDGLNSGQSGHRSPNDHTNRTVHNYSRVHNNSQYSQPYRNVQPWRPPINSRSSTNNNVNQHYDARSPSTSTTGPSSQVQSSSATNIRTTSILPSTGNVLTAPTTTATPNRMIDRTHFDIVTFQASQRRALLGVKENALDVEKRKLALVAVEKERVNAKEIEIRARIIRLEADIKELKASAAPIASTSSIASTTPAQLPIQFPSLSLKYNFPPSCDILTVSKFNPQVGFFGQFKPPSALGDPSLKILLRICNLNTEKTIQIDYINPKYKIIHNNQIIYAGRKKPHRGPLDITSTCVSWPNNMEIRLVQPPTPFVDEPLPKEAVIQVVYAYKLEISASIAALNNERYQRSENDTIELIKSKFSNECGIVDSHVKVSLTCQVFKLLYYFIACTI